MEAKNFVFYNETKAVNANKGVERRVLAYCNELMAVENHFKTGAVGALHSHPHTQITYVVSGRFQFTINGVTKEVAKGDSMCKQHEVEHGCVCLEEGVLLDIFTPKRDDFLG